MGFPQGHLAAGGRDPRARSLALSLALRWEKSEFEAASIPPPPPAALKTPAGQAGLEGLGGSSAKAASKSSPAGGLDRIWLGLRLRNKGGCRAPLSREEGAGRGLPLALWGTWMEGGVESGLPFSPAPHDPRL